MQPPDFTALGLPNDWAHTLMGTLKIELLELERGRVRGRMPVGDFNRQPYGAVHGGALIALAESLASVGTAAALDLETEVGFGQEVSASLLRTVYAGDVEAVAEALHRGRSAWVWDVKITGPRGQLVALCRVTMAIRPRREPGLPPP